MLGSNDFFHVIFTHGDFAYAQWFIEYSLLIFFFQNLPLQIPANIRNEFSLSLSLSIAIHMKLKFD